MPDRPDPTELARRLAEAEARAEHAERLATMGRLLAGVVHEINNPLTAVTMYADALAAGLADAAAREKAEAILDAGRRIQRLVRELVSYVRPRNEPEGTHELSALVDEGLRLCRSELKGSSARLERDDAPAAVRGKRESLVQVVVALVANATAAGEGHRIRVSAGAGPEGAVLRVVDAGSGMPADVLARAFEPFFTTRPDARLGLGLCTAKAIVERHGGVVTLASAPGEGTTATVTLPLA
ncbi:MAG TPA: HAMP domain-containing sensor histidine kinase [Anaeromyxobacter sp.]|nr:HAMP domain-containing sensor histidine kinase [Anaeromyxobacter sp.]